MPLESDLGMLIMRLNPYARDMRFSAAGHPGAPAAAAAGGAGNPAAAGPGGAAEAHPPLDLGQFDVQIENIYTTPWSFKGQEHNIKRAVRIQYRYPYPNAPGVLATDYLLIGYVGSNGG
jgi:hypothetical protein